MKAKISEPFLTAYNKVKNLQKCDRYLGAFIFGSVVRGEQDKNSDLDVIVLVNQDNDCKEINHPIINGIKLDITFRSLKQIKEDNENTAKKGERIPIISESIIVFDKKGDLNKLKNAFKKAKPKKVMKKDFQFIHFMLYHSDNKAKRNLEDDKPSALLAMSINLNDILKFHYQINGKWWVSNKRLLPDLGDWDPKLAKLVEKFVSTSVVSKKYILWSKILDHVAKPIGGRKEISEINCSCKVCKKDLANLI
ncbi:MAG TPA: nucleotidyltransferase domain-containing protein [Patescibacteria group bacterium]